MRKAKQLFIFFLIILFGGYTTLLQVIIFRQLFVVTEGNELIISLCLGFWLLGVSGGAFSASRIVKLGVSISTLFLITHLLLLFSPLVVMLVISYNRGVFSLAPGTILSPLQTIALSFLSIFPVSFFSGFAFPQFVEMLKMDGGIRGGDTESGRRAYGGEAIGSLIYGITFSFILAGNVDPVTIILFSFLLVIFAYFIAFTRPEGKYRIILVVVFFVVIGVLLGLEIGEKLYKAIDNIRWEKLGVKGERISTKDSKYQHIDFVKRGDEYFLYGNELLYYSFPFKYSRPLPIHLALIEHGGEIQRVLILGGGIADRIKATYLHNPSEIVYVDLDRVATQITLNYLSKEEKEILNSSSKVKLIFTDPRHFILSSKEKRFDIILLFTPLPTNAMLNRYYTFEFFREIKRVLSNGGVFMLNIDLPASYKFGWEGKIVTSIYYTLRSLFRYVELVISPEDQGYFIATEKEGLISFDVDKLRGRRKSEFWKKVEDEFTPYHLELFFQRYLVESWIRFFQKGEKSVQLNFDYKPIVYLYGLGLWEQKSKISNLQTTPSAKGIVYYISKFSLNSVMLVIIAIIGLIVGVSRFLHSTTRTVLFSGAIISISGFTVIYFEILLLLMFQNRFGSIYEQIGFLIGVIMGGMALGAFLGEFYKKKVKRVIIELSLLLIGNIVIGVVSIFSYHYIKGGALSYLIILLLLFSSGYITGKLFPSLNYILENRVRLGTKVNVAGIIDGFDHFGAFLGSITTGVIFLPQLGVVGSGLVLILLQLIGLGFTLQFLKGQRE